MSLTPLIKDGGCSLYEVKGNSSSPHGIRQLIASTPETRAICNDPFLAGIAYTRALQKGCTQILSAMQKGAGLTLKEENTMVLHILRGGLNFGLREALADAFGFNYHASAFVSAQRARKTSQSQDWIITESDYQKLSLHDSTHVLFGDVVATGTSLEHGLRKLKDSALEHDVHISGFTFFTIGSPRTLEVVKEANHLFKKHFDSFQGATIVYLEGIFQMATFNTPMRIKLDGTDLLRTESLLAPEFIESQYEAPTYPLERCTIYDAGSRAFDVAEYFEDVHDYWYQTLAFAKKGTGFKELLQERFPELNVQKFGSVQLEELCHRQLAKIPAQHMASK